MPAPLAPQSAPNRSYSQGSQSNVRHRRPSEFDHGMPRDAGMDDGPNIPVDRHYSPPEVISSPVERPVCVNSILPFSNRPKLLDRIISRAEHLFNIPVQRLTKVMMGNVLAIAPFATRIATLVLLATHIPGPVPFATRILAPAPFATRISALALWATQILAPTPFATRIATLMLLATHIPGPVPFATRIPALALWAIQILAPAPFATQIAAPVLFTTHLMRPLTSYQVALDSNQHPVLPECAYKSRLADITLQTPHHT
jgi:hypothetical protein